ncbi:hypothetical protein [Candidatus Protochlamydia phocaeensis]|uniref:hypothetical protein n=1 Tax=Candidatus Protochlamydia phocaeensis TaxID=1414722 RepID=UPI00083865E7|nr:hypothetical protein [Candidatus Protochlamydia phocaeensis]
MYKTVIVTVFLAMMLAVLYLATHMKDAYKVLPGSSSTKMAVPPFADWRQFTPQSGKFKVDLPAVPQYAKEFVNIPNTDKKRRYEMFVSEKLNGSIFMINLITYPPDFAIVSANELLHSVIEELVTSNPNSRLVDITDTTFQTLPAINFKLLNQDYEIQGIAFLLNKTVYQLGYVAKKDDVDEMDYKHFIQSFDLLPKAMKEEEKTP